MKKERTVVTKARVVKTPAKTKTIVDIYCDICNKIVDVSRDYSYGSGGHNCDMCGRDLCKNVDEKHDYTCRKYVENGSDYTSELYCPVCDNLKLKYRERYNEIYDTKNKAVESLERAMKKESLAHENS